MASASGSDVSVVYTLTPGLNGGQLLTGQTITVTDTLGTGLTYVSAAEDRKFNRVRPSIARIQGYRGDLILWVLGCCRWPAAALGACRCGVAC